MAALNCGSKSLDLSSPVVMGVLNVTPDSFSDGGEFIAPELAIAHAQDMVEAGAALVDIGGESTRPGAAEISVADELRRVVPIVEALAPALPVPVSVDTSKPEVMEAAAAAGAGMLNDVMGLRREGALEAAAASGLSVCLMHMQGDPRTMQSDPYYDDVVEDIYGFLDERIGRCEAAGIERSRLLIDPGFGFGKTMLHNARLLRELRRFRELGLPLLVGLSRKSFLGKVVDCPVGERLNASVVAAALAVWNGAAIIRAHDVAPTVEALRVVDYVRCERYIER